MPKSYKRDRKSKAKLSSKTAQIKRKKGQAKKKKQGPASCKAIAANWDPKKTARDNMASMGLVYDRNAAIPLPKNALQAELEVERLSTALAKGSVKQQKAGVIQDLESAAQAIADKYKSQERNYRLLPRDIEFCSEMIRRHGTDYAAMAKDHLNLYQETPKQIQRKLATFKRCPAYKETLAAAKAAAGGDAMEE
uniref:Nucleolar protein 16 n=1 Tax=Panagrellus redivivus TaxID=6233 RepID=A0A7E4WB04_PANRE